MDIKVTGEVDGASMKGIIDFAAWAGGFHRQEEVS